MQYYICIPDTRISHAEYSSERALKDSREETIDDTRSGTPLSVKAAKIYIFAGKSDANEKNS